MNIDSINSFKITGQDFEEWARSKYKIYLNHTPESKLTFISLDPHDETRFLSKEHPQGSHLVKMCWLESSDPDTFPKFSNMVRLTTQEIRCGDYGYINGELKSIGGWLGRTPEETIFPVYRTGDYDVNDIMTTFSEKGCYEVLKLALEGHTVWTAPKSATKYMEWIPTNEPINNWDMKNNIFMIAPKPLGT